MSSVIKIRKGLNIKLGGMAEKIIMPEHPVSRYCIKPTDFPGLTPKLEVSEGASVQAGDTLFYDKKRPEIRFTSPVCGTVTAIIRGEKRALLGVQVDKEGTGKINFGSADPKTLDREQVKEKILASGLWPAIRQRPYNIIADPSAVPKAIFISAFNTAPLAGDVDFIISNIHGKHFQTGINGLAKLTDGKIHISFDKNGSRTEELKNVSGVEKHFFSGPHPAGNPGVHIHLIDPVSKGDTVWVINIQDVSVLGKLFDEGVYSPERIIVLAGPSVIKPGYYRTLAGASLASILAGNLRGDDNRIISGNVLTGTAVGAAGSLGFYDDMVTVIPEGRYHEFFGWLSPGLGKFSFWRAFAGKMLPKKEYVLDTNLHGGVRPFVLSGQYEKVFPMDIYPIQLLKAILAEDVELMEKLGIYEVAEEDFALCEYIDPSKTEMQELIRRGIDMMIKEMNY